MEIRIKNKYIPAFKEAIKGSKFSSLENEFSRFNSFAQADAYNKFDVDVAPSSELYDFLIQVLESIDDFDGAKWIRSQKAVFESGNDAKIKSTRGFQTLLTKFVTEDVIDGWLYKRDNLGVLPYLVTGIHRISPDARYGIKAAIKITLQYATPKSSKGIDSTDIKIDLSHMQGRSLISILTEFGFEKETIELKNEYLASMEDYKNYQDKYASQFICNGRTITVGSSYSSDVRTHRDVRVINNENEVVTYIPESMLVPLFRGSVSSYAEDTLIEHLETMDEDLEEELLEDLIHESRDGDREEYTVRKMPLPYHPFIKVFNLETHSDEWVLSHSLKPYVYDSSISNKLVLPDSHRDLLDVLTTDADILFDDIIAGKSGGTIILCRGGSGLGKTLTAQAYSEITKKPLYCVHSGQLGTNPEKMDDKLQAILRRSEDWNSILLIDEADVFIRKRDNDIMHNAIVSSFLRQLESTNGIVFLTTNRSEDIDDAILTRCSALVTYEHPDKKDALKIWSILSENYEVPMSDELIEEAYNMYPSASGRDIKEILKLCSRYHQKGYSIDAERLRICGMFRSMPAKAIENK